MSKAGERIDSLTTAVEGLRQQLEQQVAQNNTLQQQVLALQGSALSPISNQGTVMTTQFKEPHVADPDKYHGARNKLDDFLAQVTLVIEVQPSRFPNDKSKILYAGSYLRESAGAWFRSVMNMKTKPAFYFSFDLFCKEMANVFGDPDQMRTAERDIRKLKQVKSCTAYTADFRRLANYLSWNDAALSSQYYSGLSEAIKDELA